MESELWYIDYAGIVVRVEIDELPYPNLAWLNYPVGHCVSVDELQTNLEDAFYCLLEYQEDFQFEDNPQIEDVMNIHKKFIMSTWPEENPVWTVEYPKRGEDDWYNLEKFYAKGFVDEEEIGAL